MGQGHNRISWGQRSLAFQPLRDRLKRLKQQWFRERRSLSFKITLLITGLIAASVGATTLFYIEREQKAARLELQNEANLLLDTLEASFKSPFNTLDVKGLRQFMEAVGRRRPLLLFSAIYNAQGQPIADIRSTGGHSTSPAPAKAVNPTGASLVNHTSTQWDWPEGKLLAGRGVKVNGEIVGAVRVELSTQRLGENITNAWNRALIIILLSPLFGIPLAQWLSVYITKPIQNLVQGTQRLAKGNFEQFVVIETNDELAILSSSFNQMGMQLKRNLDLLGRKNRDLESQTQRLTRTLHELQETQTQLIQSEKMSSLGQLVAGIAHEVNNPINFVHGNLKYLREHSEEILGLLDLYQSHYPAPPLEIENRIKSIDLPFVVEDLRNIVDSMDVGTRRIKDIVLSLRNFSRLDEAARKYVDVHDGIESTLMILKHRLQREGARPPIKLVKHYGELPVVACYPGQLNQVFMNLLANAIDALDEDCERYPYRDRVTHPPTIAIRTEYFETVNPPVITVEIEDNGPGISEEIGRKLFDPFFTVFRFT